jgi:signal transduction histidine kinase
VNLSNEAEPRFLPGSEFMVMATLSELATAWGQSQAALVDLFQATATPAERAERLAVLLQVLTPSGLSACQLAAEGQVALAWRTPVGPPAAELNAWLGKVLAGLDPLADGLICLPGLEDRLGMPGQAAAIVQGNQSWGFLLLAHSHETPAAWTALAGTLLRETARTLALLLRLEGETRQRQESADELLLGEAAAGLVHDINDCLNSILLQVAVIQVRASPEVRQDLEVIRQHGRLAAGLLRPLQQARQRQRERAQPVDLNRCVREVVAAEPDGTGRFQMELAPQLRPIQATRDGMKRLVSWLLHTAGDRQPAEAGPVLVRTWSDATRVLFTVADAGPAVPEPVLDQLFHEAEGLLDPRRVLERLAGQSLLRQFGATLQAQARAEGGVMVTVEWS